MKKVSLLALATLATLSLNSFAQSNRPANISGSQGRPASLNLGGPSSSFLSFLFKRIHTLDIQGQIQEMEKDGVIERKFIAAFSAEGALVYHYELRGDDIEEYNDTGRNAGFQLLPYTIKYSNDGKLYAAFNALSLKNMITLQNGRNPLPGDYSDVAGFFTVVDNLEFVVFKWDRAMSFDNLNTFSVDLVNMDLKLDILNSAKQSRFLAITAGARLGWETSELKLDSGETIYIGASENYKAANFGSTSLRYGMEYSDQFSNGSRLNIRMGASHNRNVGYFMDQQKVNFVNQQNLLNTEKYEQDKNQFNANIVHYTEGKKAYEAEHLNGSEISDESYSSLTGIAKPVAPAKPETLTAEEDKVIRTQVYLTPSIEFSKPINKEGKRPVRLGVGASANIPLRDTFQGGRINQDMTKYNRNLFNARIFINF